MGFQTRALKMKIAFDPHSFMSKNMAARKILGVRVLFSTHSRGFTFLSHFIFSALLLSLSGGVYEDNTLHARTAHKKLMKVSPASSFEEARKWARRSRLNSAAVCCVRWCFIIKFIYTSRTILNKVRGRSVCAFLFINTQQQQQHEGSSHTHIQYMQRDMHYLL